MILEVVQILFGDVPGDGHSCHLPVVYGKMPPVHHPVQEPDDPVLRVPGPYIAAPSGTSLVTVTLLGTGDAESLTMSVTLAIVGNGVVSMTVAPVFRTAGATNSAVLKAQEYEKAPVQFLQAAVAVNVIGLPGTGGLGENVHDALKPNPEVLQLADVGQPLTNRS